MVIYIFISGNILGQDKYMKAIFIASFGAILKEYSLKINIKKITYGKLPRTFVTSEGQELDLELGFYERITGLFTNLENNLILNNRNNINDIYNFIENNNSDYDIILVDLIDYNIIDNFDKKYLHIHLDSIVNTYDIKPHYSFSKKHYKQFINLEIYKIPYLLNEFIIKKTNIFELLNINSKSNLEKWNDIYNIKFNGIIYIYIIIKFTDSYISLEESLKHACYSLNLELKIIWVDPINLSTNQVIEILNGKKGGIIVPGGFGENGFNNKIEAIKFARENNIPFLGICYGMQIMVIEYAKNVLNITNATTQEIDYKNNSTHIIHLIDNTRKPRLGNYDGIINNNLISNKIYSLGTYNEKYRHKYKVNNKYINLFEEHGLLFTGTSFDKNIMEIAEVPSNNFFIGVQFHPELNSSIFKPHPVLISFIKSI
jgi:CTP synthase (UTP-ammonia lyase)